MTIPSFQLRDDKSNVLAEGLFIYTLSQHCEPDIQFNKPSIQTDTGIVDFNSGDELFISFDNGLARKSSR